MIQKVQVNINASKASIWKVISNIENAAETISGIQNIEILEKPENSLVGLKWKETRMMFGKPATETMWITHAVENEYYQTRAENHGAIYISKLTLKENGSQTNLAMEFKAETTTMLAKFLAEFMLPLMKKSMCKLLEKDLEDIKLKAENLSN